MKVNSRSSGSHEGSFRWSGILDMLEPTAGKRTIINARNWREIEAALDTADNGFVNRLRNQFPGFTEEDFRLCMLTRLKLTTAQQRVFQLRFGEDKKYREIAAELGISEVAVYKHLVAALTRIKNHFKS